MTVTLTIILAEVCLVLVIVLAVIATRAWRGRRRDRAAVKTLVTSIKSNQTLRVEKLAGMLKDNAKLDEKLALGKANELIKKQNKFYQDAINLYFTRNHEVLSKLDNRLEELLSQYQVMVTPGEGQAAAIDSGMVEQLSKDIAALSQDLDKLRTENAELTRQLQAAEHELDQLGREYVSAFNRPKVPGATTAPAAGSAPQMVEAAHTGGDDAGAEEGDNPSDAAPADTDATMAEQTAPTVLEEQIAPDEQTALEEQPNAPEEDQPAQQETEPAPGSDTSTPPPSDDPPPTEEEGAATAEGILTDLDLEELLAEEPKKNSDAAGMA